MIPGIPQVDGQRLLELILSHLKVEKVLLYGSRALGHQRAGSDIDLCLVAPSMNLRELLELGAAFDDLLLPWRIYLQLRHLIAHEGLLTHSSVPASCSGNGLRTQVILNKTFHQPSQSWQQGKAASCELAVCDQHKLLELCLSRKTDAELTTTGISTTNKINFQHVYKSIFNRAENSIHKRKK